MVNRGEEKVRVHMNVVPRSTENSSPEEVRQREKVVPPTMTRVYGNNPVPVQSLPS